MKIQRLLIVFTVTFAATLALVVGHRLSTEAMAVMVGVVAGVAASIPTSLIVVWMARHALASPARNVLTPESKTEPPERDTKIIIVPTPAANYPTGTAYLPPSLPLSPYASASPPRRFTVIGGDLTPEESPLPWTES